MGGIASRSGLWYSTPAVLRISYRVTADMFINLRNIPERENGYRKAHYLRLCSCLSASGGVS